MRNTNLKRHLVVGQSRNDSNAVKSRILQVFFKVRLISRDVCIMRPTAKAAIVIQQKLTHCVCLSLPQ